MNDLAFTAEVNPNEPGLDGFIAIENETWTSTDGASSLSRSDGPGKLELGKTYWYKVTVKALGDNTFNPDGFRFVYGGTEHAWDDIQVTHGDGNKTVEISGFVSNTACNPLDLSGATVTGIAAKTYNGKAQTQSPKVVVDGVTLKLGADYTLEYANNIKAGNAASMTIVAKGAYTGSVKKTFVIAKAANPLAVKAKTASAKAKKKAMLKVSKVLAVSRAQGTVTYAKKSGNKKIAINKKTGKVTVKKGLTKGTYKVKVAVTAAGNANYKAATKTITFKVKLK